VAVPLPRGLAKFNRFVTNPLTSLVVGWAPGFAMIHHRGRKTGVEHATPINIFEVEGGFIVALTYGSDVDWLKNVLAHGRCWIRYRGRRIELDRPEMVKTAEGMAAMPPIVRVILNSIGVTQFLRLYAP
jgi:deazaflavin-dependent oxidoreductase (nitroreductase family)